MDTCGYLVSITYFFCNMFFVGEGRFMQKLLKFFRAFCVRRNMFYIIIVGFSLYFIKFLQELQNSAKFSAFHILEINWVPNLDFCKSWMKSGEKILGVTFVKLMDHIFDIPSEFI